MTATSPDTTAVRRKRLAFRCWHRGTRELDLLMGRFADAHLHDLGDEHLKQLEDLLRQNDLDLYNWIVGRAPLPPAHDHDVMRLIRTYHGSN